MTAEIARVETETDAATCPPDRRRDRDAVRRFNRFATAYAGALNERLNGSEFSLAEARVIWELRHAEAPPTAAALARSLDLDPAYLSRLLARLTRRGLVETAPGEDRRTRSLALSPSGLAAAAELEAGSDRLADATLDRLSPEARARLRRAMAEAEALLSAAPAPAPGPVILRDLRPGDMGWIVHRHGALYAAEYGWDARFEAAVARIAADCIEAADPRSHRAWIAERDGEILGSVFLVPGGPGAGKLRMLYLEPAARGLGLGRTLVREVIRAARERGLSRLDLWTHSCLSAARGIYASEGFRLVASEPGAGFGAGPTVEETWSLDLTA
ncbi:bifunctional helix-turn-helix transcriptional regulator/GNAT family N-acetyltransferase [Albimonas sp. CAU 1670]|uniref:bifunctional helix-turn-helix transcriptional regulator/GNAT family N-acetyltransferase n=1 Tax=Albimonas sp. CAU 1670 TaxID=3032599 RepID=UPI0023DABEB3|nr:bifunctional helix-turn-helix transcriptional regulator/GNAT family N-acetyltransferase [Albimonas sp. CAU 1670]MDF2234434.1 bifunctional helix-turn-helix transcriptional regulator/GNAT family N-acetyltransferase [Albimonas sp. CAU 1670]